MKINKYLISWLLILFGVSVFKTQAQNIEDEAPIFKRINPLTVQKSFQFSVRPGYYTPIEGTSSYINEAGIKPIAISFEIVQPQKYSIGFDINQQYFQQYKPRAIYDYAGSIISTAQMRTINNVSVTGNYSRYFAKIENKIRPYAQMGVGIMRVGYNTYWAYIEDKKINYRPTIAPAFGIKINSDQENNWVLEAKIKYIFTPFKYDFISSVNYLAIDLALGFRWWDE